MIIDEVFGQYRDARALAAAQLGQVARRDGGFIVECYHRRALAAGAIADANRAAAAPPILRRRRSPFPRGR